MASVCASPGVGGKAAPPFANRLPARWYLNRSITIYAREASLADDAMFLKESLHGVKGGSPPPICPPDVFSTRSERAIWVLFLLAG